MQAVKYRYKELQLKYYGSSRQAFGPMKVGQPSSVQYCNDTKMVMLEMGWKGISKNGGSGESPLSKHTIK